MKKEIIITAKSVEEAVARAAEELGAPSVDAIEYTVLEEAKKGFLGIGATPAKISAAYAPTGADLALAFIRNLIDGMGLQATVTMTEDGENKMIRVMGESAGVLIGHHGDTLDSLQYLANLAANKKVAGEKREFCRITVDVVLRALARSKAERVLRYKKSQTLEPMNPYERRIIHSEVQKIEGVSTNSIGSENNRRVVLYLEDTVTASAPAYRNDANYGEF